MATISRIALIAAILTLTGAAELPDNGPRPVARPEEKVTPGTEKATPDGAAEPDKDKVSDQVKTTQKDNGKSDDKEKAAEEEKAAERPKESAADEAACRVALQKIGAVFTDAPAIEDGMACGIDKPLLLSALKDGVKVEPPATVRCETALQLARWMEGSVAPALSTAMPGETINQLAQASAYVCRNRNNAETGRISEHAFGNAIDIAGFTLKSGKTITIRPADKDPSLEGAFQRAITEAACLYFTTVLDPGSDAAHENHLHLDVKERRGGYRYCW
ncbi:extensin-like domain-containing protein [Shinella sedimenti]|uniref:extensin-like domain-containing protein n=1 Tax=Shinella sedimenti TaxID=2919913 RepID=UPI0027955E3D|nr:extensin family protein [Shinella sedimenti]